MIKREIRKELERRLPQYVLDYLTDKFEEFELLKEEVKKLKEQNGGGGVQGFNYQPQQSYANYSRPSNHYDYDTPYMVRRGGYDGGRGDIRGAQGGQGGGGSQGQGGGNQGGGQPSNDYGDQSEQRGRVRGFPNQGDFIS
jgi:hypothetical protein